MLEWRGASKRKQVKGEIIMRVGYISKRVDIETGKETFKYIEGNATRRIGVRTDTIKVKFLYGTIPYEEVLSNTEILSDTRIMIVQEPFFTNDEMKERAQKWCDWANSCENREYSMLGV